MTLKEMRIKAIGLNYKELATLLNFEYHSFYDAVQAGFYPMPDVKHGKSVYYSHKLVHKIQESLKV
jgi:hypothetical protein